jgi:sulfur carrier protein ThiS
MMKVQVECSAVLHVPGLTSGAWVEVPESTTVSGLLRHLGMAAHHLKFVAAAVNGRHVKHDHALADGDRVLLSLPIGGG